NVAQMHVYRTIHPVWVTTTVFVYITLVKAPPQKARHNMGTDESRDGSQTPADDPLHLDRRAAVSSEGSCAGAEAFEGVQQWAHRPLLKACVPGQEGRTGKQRGDPAEEAKGRPRVPCVDWSIGRMQWPCGDLQSIAGSSEVSAE